MRRFQISTLWILSLIIGTFNICPAADSQELMNAFEQMRAAALDTASTAAVDSLLIAHQDMELLLISGHLAFFQPIEIDSTAHVFGAYFVGTGNFRFTPQSDDPKMKARHHFETDKVELETKRVFFLFSGEIYKKIKAELKWSDSIFTSLQNEDAQSSMKRLYKDENNYFIFEALRSLLEPPDRPFLMANVQNYTWSKSHYYLYNPMSCEEIRLYQNKVRGPNFAQYMIPLCCYSYCSPSARITGEVALPQIAVDHYEIDAAIDYDGRLTAKTTMSVKTLKAPAQLIWMNLHEDVQINEIIDETSQPVKYLRYTDENNKSENLYLFLDRPHEEGAEFKLTFRYEGNLAERSEHLVDGDMVDDFSVTAGADWYPVYIDRGAATFAITYRTPKDKDILFESDGKMVEKYKDKDQIVSIWKVTEPTYNVFFDIRFK
ncbi:MAG: M1 family metallopeptidase [FCB group bacterium]|nr:M1 family metallopeptidase [FCB group bacterium]